MSSDDLNPLLPGSSVRQFVGPLGEPSERTREPVSVANLEREGLVGPGWDNFSADERAIASWLQDHGLEVVSVRASRIERRHTPDAVLGGQDQTVEFKTLARASVTAVARNIREGRSQSRRLVIDGRRAGLQEQDAIAGLAQALRRHTADLDEVVVLLRDASALHWP